MLEFIHDMEDVQFERLTIINKDLDEPAAVGDVFVGRAWPVTRFVYKVVEVMTRTKLRVAEFVVSAGMDEDEALEAAREFDVPINQVA